MVDPLESARPWIGIASFVSGVAILGYCLVGVSGEPCVWGVAVGVLTLFLGGREIRRADIADRHPAMEIPPKTQAPDSDETARSPTLPDPESLQFVELTDLPEADSCQACARPFVFGYRRLFVVYEIQSEDDSLEGQCAVVEFMGCQSFLGHGPNDEAIHNHPLYSKGLIAYAIQEVVNSPWVAERARLLHKDGDPALFGEGQRHFIFALKESSFECTARSYSLVGVYPSAQDARKAILASVGE